MNDGCKLDTENYDDTNISTFELWLETGLQQQTPTKSFILISIIIVISLYFLPFWHIY